jgi:hypothetical protein
VARQRISRDFSSGLPITFKQTDAVNPFLLWLHQM